MDCSLGNEIIWYLGASKYLINEKIVKIPYREWYKQKKHLAIAEELRGDIEVERDYSPYMAVVSANEKYLNNIIYEAEQYIVQTLEKYKRIIIFLQFLFPVERILQLSVVLLWMPCKIIQ